MTKSVKIDELPTNTTISCKRYYDEILHNSIEPSMIVNRLSHVSDKKCH